LRGEKEKSAGGKREESAKGEKKGLDQWRKRKGECTLERREKEGGGS